MGEWVPNLKCVDRCDCEPFPNGFFGFMLCHICAGKEKGSWSSRTILVILFW